MRILSDALTEVGDTGEGRGVLVSGEAGVGKTALTRAFWDALRAGRAGPTGDGTRSDETGRKATRSDVGVHRAACEPLFARRPLSPLFDLGDLLGEDLLARCRDGSAPFDVALGILERLGAGGPAVLIVEDLHWADEATLDVVRVLLRRIAEVPALLVGTYRDDELPADHPLRAVLARRPATRTIALAPLSAAAVARLALSSGLDPDELYRRTGGNPFYVSEVLAEVAAGGSGVPATVRHAVLARAAHLGPEARRLLDAAAVVPGRAEAPLVRAMAAHLTPTPTVTGNELGECLEAGILVGDRDAVIFRHEIARQVIEEALPPDRRIGLHRAALTVLAAGDPSDPARLSYHAEAAGDGAAVLRHAPEAARRAAASGAHRAAAAEYARALGHAAGLPAPQRAGLLAAFAAEAHLSGRPEAAADALGEARAIHREAGDSAAEGAVLLLQCRVLGSLGRIDGSLDAARAAVDVFESLPPALGRARAYAARAAVAGVAGDPDARQWLARAIDLAEQLDDRATLAYALDTLGVLELAGGDLAGRRTLERSRALAVAAGDDEAVARADQNLGWMLLRARDCHLARPYLERSAATCRAHGFEAKELWVTALQAELALVSGHWSEVEATAGAVLGRSFDDHPAARALALIVLAKLRLLRGEGDAGQLLEEAAVTVKLDRIGHLGPALALARTEVAWWEGGDRDGDDARRRDAVDAATGEAFATRQPEPWYRYELAVWRARAGLPAGDPDDYPAPWALHLSGRFEEAARWWDEHGCPYDAALAWSDSADPESIRRGHDRLWELGARVPAGVVARRLRHGGAPVRRGPRPATAANPAGLTAREQEVLALLAENLTNAEIAGRLFVSRRTAEHHVAAISRKLGVRDRAAAVGEARRQGLVPG